MTNPSTTGAVRDQRGIATDEFAVNRRGVRQPAAQPTTPAKNVGWLAKKLNRWPRARLDDCAAI